MAFKLFLDISDLFSCLCANLAVSKVTLHHWGGKVAMLIKCYLKAFVYFNDFFFPSLFFFFLDLVAV